MTQESRLAIVIDSTKAKPSADDLARSMRALDDAGVRVSSTTDNVSRSVGQMASQTDAAARSLRRGLLAVFGGISAMNIIDIADGWGQMASRIRMATESADEYERVQARMIVSANATYRNINETREAFIQLSPVLRQMGMSLDESMNAIDAFSGLMVTNAASTERGAAAMRALSVSLQKGKIDADQWITIYSTLDSIVDAIADHSGMAAEEIRRLGASGDLSVKLLADALVGQFEPIMAQVEEMPTTVRDAMQKVGNEFNEYIGTANEATGVTAGLADGISFLGENLATILNVGAVAGAGALAVYTSRTIGATAATVADTLAKRANAIQQLELAQAQATQTAATLAQTRAMAALGGSQAQVIAATKAHEVAVKQLAVAQAGVAGAGRSLLGILGGPVGLLATVGLTAAAFVAMDGASDRAKLSLDSLMGSADDAAAAFAKLGTLSRQAALDSLAALQSDQMREASRAMSEFINDLEPTTARGVKAVAQMRSGMHNEMKLLVGNAMASGGDLEQAIDGLISKWVEQGFITEESAQPYRVAATAMAQAGDQASETTRRLAELNAKNDELNASARAAAGGVGTLNDALTETDEAGARYLQRITDQSITAGLKTQRAQLEALVKAGKLVFSDEDLAAARRAADINDAASRVGRSGGGGGGRKQTTELENYVKQLKLQQTTLGMTTEQAERYRIETAAGSEADRLRALAMYDVVRVFDEAKQVQESYRAVVESLRTPEEQSIETLKERLSVLDAVKVSSEEYANVVRRISEDAFSDAPKAAGVTVEVGGVSSELGQIEDARAELETWYTTQLEMLNTFRQQRADLNAQWDAQELELKRQFEEQGARISESENRLLLASAEATLGTIANNLSVYTQTMGRESKKGFELLKAASLAQATIATYTSATEAYKSASAIPYIGWILGPAAAAAAVVAGLANVSAIQSQTFTGMAHDGIDSVPQDGTWLLQKGERVTTANTSAKLDAVLERIDARQRMGRESASQSGSSAPAAPIVNVIEDPNRAGQTEVVRNEGGGYSTNVFVSQIRRGGDEARVLEATYGLRRMGQ